MFFVSLLAFTLLLSACQSSTPASRVEVYRFEGWDEDEPAGTYPANMRFFMSQEDRDPYLEDPAPCLYDGPYNATSRTRIRGYGAQGIGFINTGSSDFCDGGKLGVVALALNTLATEALELSFTVGTVEANSRAYAWRLQYRLGREGTFEDVRDAEGLPVEYVRQEDGHEQRFEALALPEETANQGVLELRWRYYYTGLREDPDSGARSKLRLADIVVTGLR